MTVSFSRALLAPLSRAAHTTSTAATAAKSVHYLADHVSEATQHIQPTLARFYPAKSSAGQPIALHTKEELSKAADVIAHASPQAIRLEIPGEHNAVRMLDAKATFGNTHTSFACDGTRVTERLVHSGEFIHAGVDVHHITLDGKGNPEQRRNILVLRNRGNIADKRALLTTAFALIARAPESGRVVLGSTLGDTPRLHANIVDAPPAKLPEAARVAASAIPVAELQRTDGHMYMPRSGAFRHLANMHEQEKVHALFFGHDITEGEAQVAHG